MKYVALALAAIFFVFWLFGGLWYSKIGNVQIYYWLGWATLLAYLPLYWYRVYVEDKRALPSVRTQSRAKNPDGRQLAPVPADREAHSLDGHRWFSHSYGAFNINGDFPSLFYGLWPICRGRSFLLSLHYGFRNADDGHRRRHRRFSRPFPPFDQLARDDLLRVAVAVTVRSYSAGTDILIEDGSTRNGAFRHPHRFDRATPSRRGGGYPRARRELWSPIAADGYGRGLHRSGPRGHHLLPY